MFRWDDLARHSDERHLTEKSPNLQLCLMFEVKIRRLEFKFDEIFLHFYSTQNIQHSLLNLADLYHITDSFFGLRYFFITLS